MLGMCLIVRIADAANTALYAQAHWVWTDGHRDNACLPTYLLTHLPTRAPMHAACDTCATLHMPHALP